MQDIYITGGAMTAFGRHTGVLAPELAQQAILKAMDDAGVEPGDIQAIYCANVLGGMILGQLVVRDLGFKGIPVYNVENACASGATGVHLARHALLAQQYDTVLVFGIEQLTALGGGTIPLQRNDHKTELYAKAGMVLPAVYAMRGTRFLHERDATPADLAAVAVKNRHHGSLNEYAQQRSETTLEEVLASRMIADPLTLLQCCPSQVDGAAAVVLSTRKPQQDRAGQGAVVGGRLGHPRAGRRRHPRCRDHRPCRAPGLRAGRARSAGRRRGRAARCLHHRRAAVLRGPGARDARRGGGRC